MAARTDQGLVRDRNEDAFRFDEERGLVIVADGMGGHPGGDVASKLAVSAIDTALSEDTAGIGLEERLVHAFAEAGDVLATAAEADPGLLSMGTTAVVAIVGPDGSVTCAHLGDSRAYLVRTGPDAADRGEARRLTEDHTMASSPNTLLRALSPESPTEPDIATATLAPGDWLLLCTDGLTDLVSDAELPGLLTDATLADDGCDRLIAAALERGAHDNVTVALVRIDPTGQV